MVHQKAILFKGTIRSNLLMANPNASEEEMLAALKTSEAIDFVNDKGGLDAEVEENGRNFSGGQKQRLCIARALLKDAPIVLLDEATASLDVENETRVQGALSRLLVGKTVLVIAHRMRTVEAADKIIVLADGRVAEEGTPAELMNKNGLYHRMVDLQRQSAGWRLN